MVSAISSNLCWGFFSRLKRCNSFSHYRAIPMEGRDKKEEESQKIDDLPILATCQSGNLAMVSNKVNSPLLREALDND